ncbi:hypothetical protein HOC37_03025 [bacterium]|jgi:hypothetical protein|nr:hypothetical protein [bacterium]
MRLWSIHPKYLDSVALVALWREGLLAKKVLAGKTKGYKNHPQLIRFKNTNNPIKSINCYLSIIYDESIKRKYQFNVNLINYTNKISLKIPITTKQLEYEFHHLLKKYERRNQNFFNKIYKISKILQNPLFNVQVGKIASWEKTSQDPPLS